MDFLATLIPQVAEKLGISSSTLVFYLMVLVFVAKVISRLIPEDSIGWKASVRSVARIIAADISSTLTPGVTQMDVAKKVIGKEVEAAAEREIVSAASEAEALVPEVVGDVARRVVPAFPGARDAIEDLVASTRKREDD